MADRCATLFAMRSLAVLAFDVVFLAGVRLELPLMKHLELGLDQRLSVKSLFLTNQPEFNARATSGSPLRNQHRAQKTTNDR